MKTKKNNNRNQEIEMKEQMENKTSLGKSKRTKVKYNHKNHWLEQDDSDYEFPNYKDEEE